MYLLVFLQMKMVWVVAQGLLFMNTYCSGKRPASRRIHSSMSNHMARLPADPLPKSPRESSTFKQTSFVVADMGSLGRRSMRRFRDCRSMARAHLVRSDLRGHDRGVWYACRGTVQTDGANASGRHGSAAERIVTVANSVASLKSLPGL